MMSEPWKAEKAAFQGISCLFLPIKLGGNFRGAAISER